MSKTLLRQNGELRGTGSGTGAFQRGSLGCLTAGWSTSARAPGSVKISATRGTGLTYSQRVKRHAGERPFPPNFRVIFSMGGVEDHLLDPDTDRHAEVFPDLVTLADAGYTDQEENDLFCVLLDTTRVGIPANNIPAFRKRMGDSTFGQIERDKGRRRVGAV